MLDLDPATALAAGRPDLPHTHHLPTRPLPELLWLGRLGSHGVPRRVEEIGCIIGRSADLALLER